MDNKVRVPVRHQFCITFLKRLEFRRILEAFNALNRFCLLIFLHRIPPCFNPACCNKDE